MNSWMAVEGSNVSIGECKKRKSVGSLCTKLRTGRSSQALSNNWQWVIPKPMKKNLSRGQNLGYETKLVELYIKVWPSNELIKVKIPPSRIWKADVSSVSLSLERISTLSTCLMWPNFHVSLSHRRSTTFYLQPRNLTVWQFYHWIKTPSARQSTLNTVQN